MSNILEEELNKLEVFENNIPDLVYNVANSIPSNTIPMRMKYAIAISEIITFASQFRKNIQHWNGSSIPINAITFCIAKSGASKDSSVNACKKCFETGYNIIHELRETEIKELAINTAKELDLKDYDKYSVYKEYLPFLTPLTIGISTVEGLLQNLADLSKLRVGSGYIKTGEIGAELASNPNFVDNIKAIAELYDEGNKETKALKDTTKQTVVKNMPVNAMLMGSQDNLLYDESIKRKFITEFTTKMGRRSFFIFVNEDIPTHSYDSIMECIKQEREREDNAKNYRDKVLDFISEITPKLIKSAGEPIKVSDEVRDLYILYMKYNEWLANRIEHQYPITKLHRTHMQWKALKTAGAFALMDCSDTIELHHYKAAIEYCESVSNDIKVFEKELAKEPYEVFVDYAKSIAIDCKSTVTLHTLRKLGFIPSKGNPNNKLKELVQLASSCDSDGTYSIKDDSIVYKKIIKTSKVGISYKVVPENKEERHKVTADGYLYKEMEFDKLSNVLVKDTAFSPFRFKDGKRGVDNIDSTCKWLALDIDKSTITDIECHDQLRSINHHICRTSDPNNNYKFRLLIELDAEVDIPNNQWRLFISEVGNELGLDLDVLPKSQIFYGYKVSSDYLLSTIDQYPLNVKPILDIISVGKEDNEVLTKAKSNSLLNNPKETFYFAYNAKQGEGSRRLMLAAYYAKRLGADKEYIINLVKDINNSWYLPMKEQRFNSTILSQIKRWEL